MYASACFAARFLQYADTAASSFASSNVRTLNLNGFFTAVMRDTACGVAFASASFTACLMRMVFSAAGVPRLCVEPDAPSRNRNVPPRSSSSSCAASP